MSPAWGMRSALIGDIKSRGATVLASLAPMSKTSALSAAASSCISIPIAARREAAVLGAAAVAVAAAAAAAAVAAAVATSSSVSDIV